MPCFVIKPPALNNTGSRRIATYMMTLQCFILYPLYFSFTSTLLSIPLFLTITFSKTQRQQGHAQVDCLDELHQCRLLTILM